MKNVKANVKVVESVDSYLKSLKDIAFDKSARILSRAIGKDLKLTRFLGQDFAKGNSLFVDKVARNKKLAEIENGHGYTSVKEKQARIIKMLAMDVQSIVDQKHSEVTDKGKLSLDESQKKALASKLIEYQKFVTEQMLVGLSDIAITFGVIEETVKDSTPTPTLAVVEE